MLGHPVKWLGTWGVNAALLALAALGLYLAFRNAVPAGTGPLVLLMFVAPAGVRARPLRGCAWRCSGSEIALVQRLRPWPPAPEAPQPAVEPLPGARPPF